MRRISLQGHDDDLDPATPSDVWTQGVVYPWPAAAAATTIVYTLDISSPVPDDSMLATPIDIEPGEDIRLFAESTLADVTVCMAIDVVGQSAPFD